MNYYEKYIKYKNKYILLKNQQGGQLFLSYPLAIYHAFNMQISTIIDSLPKLKELGFKTFDGIIDESYDEEPDQIKRYQMVYEQIMYLMNIPQEQILEQIKPIVDYNYNHMMTTDWYNDFSRNFSRLFNNSK